MTPDGTKPTLHEGRVVVACGADEEYAMPLAVMLLSLVERIDRSRAVSIFVLDGGLTPRSRRRLDRCLLREGMELHWVDARATAIADLPTWGRMSTTTYTRLLLTGLLPASIDRVIWLDCDVLVNADLAALWSEPLEGRPVLAAQDMIVPYVSSPGGVQDYEALGLAPGTAYFNAGVMVVNLDVWRDEDVPRSVLDYLRNHAREVVYWDQEGLNAVLANRWGALDPRWNQNASVAGRSYYRPEHLDGETYRKVVQDPWIIHFSGNVKPWTVPDTFPDPARARYFQHLDQTPWTGWRPRRTLGNTALGLYETSRLRNLLYPLENPGLRMARKWSLWGNRAR